MSFLDTLISAQASAAAAFGEFIQRYNTHQKVVYCFVEGWEDRIFYFSALRAILPDEWTPDVLRCGRRDAVLEVFSLLCARTIPRNRTMFFIDKDLSDVEGSPLPTAPNIFVTRYYSIENYLVTSSALIRTLIEILRIEPSPQEKTQIEARFNTELERFARWMRPLTAWTLAARRAGAKVHLDSINLSDLCQFDQSLRLRLRRPLLGHRWRRDYLLSRCSVLPSSSLDLRSTYSAIATIPEHKRYVRGHYEAWFLVEFVRSFQTALESRGKRVSARTQFHVGNFVEIVSPRASIPTDLLQFIERATSELE